MNQLGSIFRDARTKSGKTIHDAVKETKIAEKYLLAIENENFDVFPGETYLIGFLRNYAQFLGLDADEMVQKYRDYMIQEQPAPIEQLTARPKNTKKYFLLVSVFMVIIITLLFVFVFGKGGEKARVEMAQTNDTSEEAKSSSTKERIVVFEEEELIKDFEKGDVIEIPQKDRTYRISIDEIGNLLDFSIGTIPFSLSTDEHVEIDFDRDGRKDVMFRMNQLGEGRVNLALKKLYTTELSDTGIRPIDQTVAKKPGGPPEVVIIKTQDLVSQIPIAPQTGFQIVSSYEKTAINTHVRANSTSYFSYTIDEEEYKESLLKDGDEISMLAKDELKFMVANAQGIEVKINDVSVSLEKRGAVVAKIVRWYRDKDNRDLYHLIIDDLEK